MGSFGLLFFSTIPLYLFGVKWGILKFGRKSEERSEAIFYNGP